MSDHHVRRTSHHRWTSSCWSYLLYDSCSTFRSPCSEAMSVHARLVNTRCMRTLESITPDHHVVLRNNEPSQRCTVRGNTFLEIIIRDHLTYYRRSKQIRCKNMINITCNQIVTWYGQYHFAPFDLHLRGSMIIVVTGMTPWSLSSCLLEVVSSSITSTTMANALAIK